MKSELSGIFQVKMVAKNIYSARVPGDPMPSWGLWVQNVSPGWVKNGQKCCFHTSHLTTNQFSRKTKFLTAIAN